MIISDFYSEISCNSIMELEQILQKRYKDGSNEINLETEEGFPKMSILINNKYACVHFFRNEEDCGLYAYNENKITTQNIIFHIGHENSETEISNNLIISSKQAINLAKYFFKNMSMAKEVKWFEL